MVLESPFRPVYLLYAIRVYQWGWELGYWRWLPSGKFYTKLGGLVSKSLIL